MHRKGIYRPAAGMRLEALRGPGVRLEAMRASGIEV